jgi:hypothetical protein
MTKTDETQTTDETEHEEDRQRLADRVLGAIEDAVYWAIAVVLIAGSVALLVSQFDTLLRLRNSPASMTMLQVLDGLLLIFILSSCCTPCGPACGRTRSLPSRS